MLAAAILLSSFPAQLGQFLRMRVKETQAPLHCGRLACVTSLRASLARISPPLFRAFPSLNPDGGTFPCPCDLYDLCCAIGATFKTYFFS